MPTYQNILDLFHKTSESWNIYELIKRGENQKIKEVTVAILAGNMPVGVYL